MVEKTVADDAERGLLTQVKVKAQPARGNLVVAFEIGVLLEIALGVAIVRQINSVDVEVLKTGDVAVAEAGKQADAIAAVVEVQAVAGSCIAALAIG